MFLDQELNLPPFGVPGRCSNRVTLATAVQANFKCISVICNRNHLDSKFLRVLCWSMVKQGELVCSLGFAAGLPLFCSILHSTSCICIWGSSLQFQHLNSVHTHPTAVSCLFAPLGIKMCTLVGWSTYQRSSFLP